MSDYEKSLDAMMRCWNTTDADERRALIEPALEHSVHFVDPNHIIIGR